MNKVQVTLLCYIFGKASHHIDIVWGDMHEQSKVISENFALVEEKGKT